MTVDNNPTPEQRADFIMQRLEQFIRDGRTVSEGMNLQDWQAMAKIEIANAIEEAKVNTDNDEVVTKRLLFTFGASFTTIGFWGALWTFGQAHYMIVALLCGTAGFFMIGTAVEWRFRKYLTQRRMRNRSKSLGRTQDLTKRIKKLESDLEKEEKALKKQLKATKEDKNAA